MNATCITLLAAGLAVAAFAQPAVNPAQPGPGLQKLQIWHGDWTYVTEFRATPLWTAGQVTGAATTRPTLGGFGAETAFTEPTPWGTSQSIETYWLDPRTNDIGFIRLGNDGRVEQGSYALSGDNWTWQGTFLVSGRSWKTRGKGSLAADHASFTENGEISPDGGMWLAAFTRTSTRALPRDSAALANELAALEHARATAYGARDVKTLDRLTADDWSCTTPEGRIIPKAQDLAAIGTTDAAPTTVTLADLKVRVYGDTAIVTGRRLEAATHPGKTPDAVFQITDTWRREGSGWRCHATHLSQIVPPLDADAVRREVARTVQATIAAEEHLDAEATFAQHADVPGYVWTDIDGSLHNFADTRKIWTDYIAGCTQLKYSPKHEQVEVLGPDAAIYLWHGAADVTTKDGKLTRHDSWTIRYLCRRLDGEWKIVGGQQSAVPPPAPPPPPVLVATPAAEPPPAPTPEPIATATPPITPPAPAPDPTPEPPPLVAPPPVPEPPTATAPATGETTANPPEPDPAATISALAAPSSVP